MLNKTSISGKLIIYLNHIKTVQLDFPLENSLFQPYFQNKVVFTVHQISAQECYNFLGFCKAKTSGKQYFPTLFSFYALCLYHLWLTGHSKVFDTWKVFTKHFLTELINKWILTVNIQLTTAFSFKDEM